ncbi:hypothetical protein AKJ16_DCAP14956 [Drosera capensis]
MSDIETLPSSSASAIAELKPSHITTLPNTTTNNNPFFSIFSNLPFKLPFINQEDNKKKSSPVEDENEPPVTFEFSGRIEDRLSELKVSTPPPDRVRFRMREVGWGEEELGLKIGLEDEDQKSSPIVAYALGGFLMLRWAWAKWTRSQPAPAEDDE